MAAAATTVRIRPMRARDVAEVAAIEAEVYPRPWSASLFRSELERDDRVYVVARRRRSRGPIAGYGGVLVAAGEAHVLTVAVRPEARGRGIGAALLLVLLGAARARGAEAATLEVRPSNHAARTLYRRFGFVEAGRRPRYYEDDGEDALIMWLHGLQGADVGERLRELADALGQPPPADR